MEEAAVPDPLEGLGPRTRQLGELYRRSQRSKTRSEIPFDAPDGPRPSEQQDTVMKTRPLGGGYCYEHPARRLLTLRSLLAVGLITFYVVPTVHYYIVTHP